MIMRGNAVRLFPQLLFCECLETMIELLNVAKQPVNQTVFSESNMMQCGMCWTASLFADEEIPRILNVADASWFYLYKM